MNQSNHINQNNNEKTDDNPTDNSISNQQPLAHQYSMMPSQNMTAYHTYMQMKNEHSYATNKKNPLNSSECMNKAKIPTINAISQFHVPTSSHSTTNANAADDNYISNSKGFNIPHSYNMVRYRCYSFIQIFINFTLCRMMLQMMMMLLTVLKYVVIQKIVLLEGGRVKNISYLLRV